MVVGYDSSLLKHRGFLYPYTPHFVNTAQKYLAITRLDSNNTRSTNATINSEIEVGSGVMKNANAISAP